MRYLGVEFKRADIFPSPNTWPSDLRILFYKSHKDRKERFKLWLFLWANGLEAYEAMKWVLWHKTYDAAAIRSMHDLARKAYTEPEYLMRFPHYSLHQYSRRSQRNSR